MKEVKKVLSAALAATLATGALGTVAGAAPMDDLYKAAYDATLNALNKKDQDSINAARVAIDKLPSELQAYKGEFSKQVDTVQHPILVTIVDSINNAEKTLKQSDINVARKAIPANLPEVWRNSYSTGVDAAQQKLINKTVEAANKALETGKKADLDAAKALLNDVKSVENNDGVKAWITTYEKEFTSKVKLTVDGVEVLANDTIKVNFTREVDAKTVVADAFKVYATENKSNISVASVKTSSDKMSVEVKFSEKVTEGTEYTVDVKDLKDLNGNAMVAAGQTFVYAKADSVKVSLNKAVFSPNEDLKKSVVVKDNLGRDITKDVKVTFETTNSNVINKDGIVVGALKDTAIVTPVVKDNDGNVLAKGEKVAVEIKDTVATEYQGYSVYTHIENLGAVYSKFDRTTEVKMGETAHVAFFFKDQYGAEMQSQDGIKKVEVLEEQTSSVATATVKNDTDLQVNGLAEGTAYFKVKITTNDDKTVERVISVNVIGKASLSTIELDQTNVVFEKNSIINQNIKVSVKDQYGDLYDAANDKNNAGTAKSYVVRMFIKNPSTGEFVNLSNASDVADIAQYATTSTASAITFTKGEAFINTKAADKVGKNTFKVQYELKDGKDVVKTLEKEFTVEVKEKADFKGYNVETVTTLDKYDDVATVDTKENEGTFKIEKLSTNGAVIDYVDNAEVKLYDKNGEAVTSDITVSAAKDHKYTVAVKDTADAGEYTVKVKIGEAIVKTYTLTVKDSTRTATTVQFNKTGLKVDATAATIKDKMKDVALNDLVTVRDQDGKELLIATGDKVTATSDKVLATDFSVAEKANEDGTYNVTISKVKVTFADGSKNKAGKENISVSVTLKVQVNK